MSLKSKTIKAVMWAFVQNGGRQIISTLVFLALARFFLSKDEFGLVALTSVLITFLNVLVRQGFGTAIVQRKTINNQHLDTVFWVNVISSVVLTILLMLFSEAIASALGEPRVAELLQILSLQLIFTALSLTHEAILTRELRFKSLAIRTLLASILSGAVGLTFAFHGAGVWALIAMQLTMSVVGLAVLWYASTWRPRFHFSFRALKELLPMSSNMAGVAVVATINDLIDQFIIGTILGTSALGIYFVAQRVVRLLMIVFVQSVSSVALPSFSRLNGDIDKIRNALLRAIKISTFISFPIFGGLTVTSDLVIPILFGDKWEEASQVMSILCISGVVGCISYFFSPILTALDHSKDVLLNQIIAAVLLIVACMIGVQFGLVGVAIGFVSTGLFMFPIWARKINSYLIMKKFDIYNSFLSNLIACVLMILVLMAMRHYINFTHDYIEMGSCILMAILSYCGIAWKISNDSFKEVILVIKHVVSKKS